MKNRYNPHLNPEEIKSQHIKLKFTAAEWEEIQSVVGFSGKDRMNMCREGVLEYVRKLKQKMNTVGGIHRNTESKSGVSHRNTPLSEVDEAIFTRHQMGMTAQQIAEELAWPLIMIESVVERTK